MSSKRLERAAYKQLRLQVLARDRWQCQFCGTRNNLEIHHQHLRARGGKDQIENLITLCDSCHRNEHHH
jgi:5-methylcytosine-specific restriction endonuclease McrA